MRKYTCTLVILIAALGIPSPAQTHDPARLANPIVLKASPSTSLSGKWTYRSYHNRPDVIVNTDAALALKLIFGEGVMTIDATSPKAIKGDFDMGGGYLLDLTGTMRPQTSAAPAVLHMSGKGRPGTPTDGWQYDYTGYVAYTWPDGIGQIPAIVGTVVRVKPHGQAKAGYVASFIAAKQP